MDHDTTLRQIMRRTTHITSKIDFAVNLILERPQPPDTNPDPTATDLEAQVDHWAFMVPDDHQARAQLFKQMTGRVSLSQATTPRTLAALLNNAAKEAYKQLFGHDWTARLSTSPATGPDPDTIQADLRRELTWRYLRRGETLFTEGASGDAMYILVDGRLRVVVDQGRAGMVTVAELRPGEIVGESAVLTGGPYETTVYALRDSDIVRLDRDGFERLVSEYPRAMMVVAVGMVNRLRDAYRGKRPKNESRAFVILPAVENPRAFSHALEAALEPLGRVSLLSADHITEKLPGEIAADLEASVDDYAFVDWLQDQANDHDFTIYEADPAYPNWTRRCIEQADRILLLGRAGNSPEICRAEQLLSEMPNPELSAPVELVLVHTAGQPTPTVTRNWLELRPNIQRHHHVAISTGTGMDRLVRFLRDQAVGFVFGGGGMRGTAHVGAIRALHEAGIYADWVGGTSSGSIVAGQYALGWTPEDMLRITKERLLQRGVLMDLTFPYAALTRGYRLNQVYESMFGDARIEDQWVKSFYISANLTMARMETNEFGLIRDAVRRSTSLAGTHPPVPDENGDLHIDGGVFDNTPADVMRVRVGDGQVFAVDLGFTVRARTHYDYGNWVNGFQVLFNRLNPLTRSRPVPNILSILTRSNALASITVTEDQAAHADLLIRPPVSGYGLFDFDAYKEIHDAGYEAAARAIEQWQAR